MHQQTYSCIEQLSPISTEIYVRLACIPSGYLNQPPRPTDHGSSSMFRCNEYWQSSWPLLGRKQQFVSAKRYVLLPALMWHADLVRWKLWLLTELAIWLILCARLIGDNHRWLKVPWRGWAVTQWIMLYVQNFLLCARYEHEVAELILIPDSQHAGDIRHTPSCRWPNHSWPQSIATLLKDRCASESLA